MTNDTDTRFIAWLASHGDIVARIANVHALTPADRADLKQQILIELWRSARRFDGRCAVTTWIYRVALNTALTFRRTEGRRRRRFTEAAWEQLEDIPAPDASQEPIQQLYAAIYQLEPIDRSLVLLSLDARSYERLRPFVEIAPGSHSHALKSPLREGCDSTVELPAAGTEWRFHERGTLPV